MDLVPDVARIAVLRANSLGDFVLALPALDALRAAYLRAEIVLLGAPWHARFLTGRPGPVDRVIVVPAAEGIRPPEPGEASVSTVDGGARGGFDLALQLHGGGRNSNPMVNALGARVTAGLRAPDAEPLDRWIRYVHYQPEVARYLEVVALVGAEPVTIVPRLAVTAADRTEAAAVAGAPERPRVALHPGANDARRRWPVARFVEVADVLLGEGYEVVVTGTDGERDLVHRVAAAARGPVIPIAGELSLGGLVGLLAGCAAVVANDTGPLHLAVAVGTPAIGVYWVGNVINYAAPLRDRHRPLISWTVRCPACGTHLMRDPCDHRVSLVDDVDVNDVLAALFDLLRETGVP